jgi:hypothetical protein
MVMTIPSSEGSGAAVTPVGRDGIIGGYAAASEACAACEARVQIAGEASRMTARSFRYLLDQNPSVRRLAARFDSAMLAQAQQTALCNAVHPLRPGTWLRRGSVRRGFPYRNLVNTEQTFLIISVVVIATDFASLIGWDC